MDGYNLFVISGIDGKFDEFNQIENQFEFSVSKLCYDRTHSFVDNVQTFRSIIEKSTNDVILLGWSIGAVAAAFLAELEKVKGIVLINAFYDREEVLRKRNISCDEQVTLSSVKDTNKRVYIICGEKDDKIPYTESEKIKNIFSMTNCHFFKFSNARHNLGSFPSMALSDITNKIKGEIF